MIVSQIYTRVLHIRVPLKGNSYSTATAFTIDVDKRHYLITASHVLDNWEATKNIQVMQFKKWRDVNLTLIKRTDLQLSEIDIAVLAPDQQLTPHLYLSPTCQDLAYGNELYFLGFPYGWDNKMIDSQPGFNNGFPMPFIRRAILSASDGKMEKMYLDSQNNQGFSGSPVVFNYLNKGRPTNIWNVCGVVSGYPPAPIKEPIYKREFDKQGNIINENESKEYFSIYNSGFTIAFGIKTAVDFIKANPIGWQIPKTK